jgi:hypothetical protein
MALKRFIASNGLDANSKTISNVTDPVLSQDASTKNYSSNASNLVAGTVPATVMPAHTGDATSPAGSVALTLATVNSNVGAFGSSTAVPIVTVNAKGLVTGITTASISGAITIAGDASGTGVTGGTTTVTLATVNSDITAVGSSSSVPVITANAKGLVTSISSATITPAAIGAVATTALGANSGVATLDATGKLTTSQIPSSLVGSIVYQGVWNASTNTPAIPTASAANKGYYYKISVAGTTAIDGYSNWSLGDLIISDGTAWDNVQGGSPDVVSVAGRVGAVTLSSDDISGLATSATTDTTNASNISSGTLSAARLPALTGDITTTIGGAATTLAASGVSAGTYNNSATTVQPITVDSKGRVTGVGAAITIAPTFANIASKPTTLSGFGITDALGNTQAAPNSVIPLTYGDIGCATLTTSATTANQVIDINSSTAYRSVSYAVQVTSATAYQSCNINVIHDGTTAYISEFADIATGAVLASFDADVSGGNLRLLTTPVNAATTYKVIKTMIDI